MKDYRNKDVRARVYRERTDLKEFKVNGDWTVDRIMFAHFISLKITDLPNQADCILASYNNAYYIATIILNESFPNAYVSQYMDIALSVPTDNEEYRVKHAVLTMVMVINILQRYEEINPVKIYSEIRHLLDERIMIECDRITHGVETYKDVFLKNIEDASEIRKYPITHPINYDDFIPLRYDVFIPLSQTEEETSGNTEALASPQERIEELEEQVAQYRKKTQGIALGLNQAQASLFVLSLANTLGFNYTNKKNLAPIAHSLFGWGKAQLAKYMSISCNAEERGELANLFKDICPKLYKTILNKGVTPEETPEETPPA